MCEQRLCLVELGVPGTGRKAPDDRAQSRRVRVLARPREVERGSQLEQQRTLPMRELPRLAKGCPRLLARGRRRPSQEAEALGLVEAHPCLLDEGSSRLVRGDCFGWLA